MVTMEIRTPNRSASPINPFLRECPRVKWAFVVNVKPRHRDHGRLFQVEQTPPENSDPATGRSAMNGYFKALRRKIGIGILFIACGFAAGWVRSLISVDTISAPPTIEVGPSRVAIHYWHIRSGAGHLITGKNFTTLVGDVFVEPRDRPFFQVPQWNSSENVGELRAENLDFQWYVYGFGFLDEPGFGYHFVVPYWSMVTPLTLLSAWLLFSKLRLKPPSIRSVNPGS